MMLSQAAERDSGTKSERQTMTNLEPEWFSMRYQVAEKFSLVKSPLIPGNVTSMSVWGILPLGEERTTKMKYNKYKL